MTLENVYCAICGEKTPLDVDHVEIEAETVCMRDQNDVDKYVLHTGCAMDTFGYWSDPI